MLSFLCAYDHHTCSLCIFVIYFLYNSLKLSCKWISNMRYIGIIHICTCILFIRMFWYRYIQYICILVYIISSIFIYVYTFVYTGYRNNRILNIRFPLYICIRGTISTGKMIWKRTKELEMHVHFQLLLLLYKSVCSHKYLDGYIQ